MQIIYNFNITNWFSHMIIDAASCFQEILSKCFKIPKPKKSIILSFNILTSKTLYSKNPKLSFFNLLAITSPFLM
jgi:hypothetical protein